MKPSHPRKPGSRRHTVVEKRILEAVESGAGTLTEIARRVLAQFTPILPENLTSPTTFENVLSGPWTPPSWSDVQGSYIDAGESADQLLDDLFQARLSAPGEIGLSLSITLDGRTVEKSVTIGVPVGLQELFKPANIVARSVDGRAALLAFSVASETEGHRAVLMTFKPSLMPEDAIARRLMANAVGWTAFPPAPVRLEKAVDLDVPGELKDAAASLASEMDASLEGVASQLLKPDRAETFTFEVEDRGVVALYWWEATGRVETHLNGIPQPAVPTQSFNVTIEGPSTSHLLLVNLPRPGLWNVSLILDAEGLLIPTAAEFYSTSAPPTDTTRPMITITSPADGATLTSTSVVVTGTASDDVSVERVEISTDETSWVLATGTTSWSGTLTITEGDNTLYGRATDTSGNTATESIAVTVETPSPGTQPSGPQLSPLALGVGAVVVVGAVVIAALLIRRRRGSR